MQEAVTKKGKKYLKVTVGDKYLYDWNFKAAQLDGKYCLADFDDGQFPKINQIMPVDKPPVQATIIETPTVAQIGGVCASNQRNPANSYEYLAGKLAVELVSGEQIAVDEKIDRWKKAYDSILEVLWSE